MKTTPTYINHPRTIRVSGKSECLRVANCAAHFLTQRKTPVELLVIGANASQQACKVIGLLKSTIEEATEGRSILLVEHLHVKVPVNYVTAENAPTEADATVFRCLVVRKEDYVTIAVQNSVIR